MKSIGFVTLDKSGVIITDYSDLSKEDQEEAARIINAAPNAFKMTNECPLRVVEAFINED